MSLGCNGGNPSSKSPIISAIFRNCKYYFYKILSVQIILYKVIDVQPTHAHLSIILIFFLFRCNFVNVNNQQDTSKTCFFSSPAEAIQIITELLKKANFKILAKYYDLSNSEIKLSELESGDFFIRKERPEFAHPAGFWRYKHPFAPGFTFNRIQATAKDEVYIIKMSISIDQSSDSLKQIGLSYFYMVKSDKGWKVLPDLVAEDEHHVEMPNSIQ